METWLKECCKIKNMFLKFVKYRTSFRNKNALRRSYEEFKRRNGGFLPDFDYFFNALKYFKMIYIRGDRIDFSPLNGQSAAKDGREAHDKLQEREGNWPNSVHGIRITYESPNGDEILRLEKNEKHFRKLKVENIGAKPVALTRFLLDQAKHFSLVDEHKATPQNPLPLPPGGSCEIQVIFQCRIQRYFSAKLTVEYTVDPQGSGTLFHIEYCIKVLCGTTSVRELAPNTPYRAPQRRQLSTEQRIIIREPGPKRSSWNQQGPRVRLKWYPMYRKKVTALKSNSGDDKERALLESPLRWRNYTQKLHLLLHLEELQMVVNTERYNIPNEERKFAIMKKDREYLVLELPGLSENRPSVRPGDELFVYPVEEKELKYSGSVVSVQQESVTLRFHTRLLDFFKEGMKFHVEFHFNRLLLNIQHRAVELAVKQRLQKLLFPDIPSRQSRQLTKLKLFDERLEENTEQNQAVHDIVFGTSMPAPYLVFGPPGTGKTVTLVEAIKQIQTKEDCHILACAPTNSAVDLLCKKIVHLGNEGDVFRLYALNLTPDFVPKELKTCCNLDRGSFYLPATKNLMSYKIIVTTLYTASRLVTEGVHEGHFTHVFVDEAGQALETECLIPLAGLVAAGRGQVVLAGDPKQLGPIVNCAAAKKYGLNVSLLERLLLIFSDDKSIDGAFNSRCVTKLLRNYRSHPDILEVPNRLFYKGELKPHEDESCKSCCDWEGLPQPGFPVIFHGVKGLDEREASSPSFFNILEVEILKNYVNDLLQTKEKNGSPKIRPKEIGIITPYRKQVTKIKQELKILGKDFKSGYMDDIKVGPVEEFQGDERRVILVSTVRSQTEHLKTDEVFHMGFVCNKKRLNVALTRAKALLIVVGNPDTLQTNEQWKTFIDFCKEKGGYVCPGDSEEEREE
ncbi:putative helicase mov-10-B.2 [Salarias fasciatus]|uniref:putative helicase mov-10-B.2 n=1 Tax=Salarias fasciatus TaxID=181472 RepID=UPI001176B713|nr:putative helicase mov-10-B.2 [Salarias fasciatus]